MSELRFDNRVAIITGAGNGLGRSHALLLGSRGAKVVVNDLGGSAFGDGKSQSAADKVVEEIKAAGGTAIANYDSVEDGDKIVKTAIDAFGKVDILVNNAGILRDTSFQKMSQNDWDLVYKVHVLGAFRVTHAAWNSMRDAGYGRIVFTASAAGIYGNFGQANYAMAKLGLVGLASTLAIEGKKKNVFVNTIAPIAGSRLTETVLPPDLIDALKPEYVSPLVAWLANEACTENGGLFEVGGGFFAKLRWQRSSGKVFKLGRAIPVESVQKAWPEITGFDKEPSYPTDVTASMQPILGNLGSKSQGGNALIDVDAALGYQFPTQHSSYDERDLALYALGVGAAQNPLDAEDLRYVYEMNGEGFFALPTYAVIPAVSAVLKMAKDGTQAPGINYGFDRVLHGEQYTEIKRPLPTSAKLKHKVRIVDIFDKGKNALVVSEIKSFDESGEEVAHNEITTFVRGAGGWGGDRGPSSEVNIPPDRAPDAVITEKTHENQAILYRLSGDWNPLHVDPSFAKAMSFEKPILHGLCTFGYAGRHVVKSFAPKGDPRYFKSIKVRFADSVIPGETLVTEMWKESDTRIIFRCKVKERDKVVVSNAAIELFAEIPKEKAKADAKPAAKASGAASSGPVSADVFWGIRHHIEQNPSLVGQVASVFQFKITREGRDAQSWVVDLKNGKGSVTEGVADKADVTLEISEDDFMGMAAGKLNAQKLYFGGKLKISGNVMASQKLDFLSKIDPKVTEAAMNKAGYIPGGGAVSADPSGASAGEGDSKPVSGDVFVAIADHIVSNPDLASRIQSVFLFKLSSPESVWTVDLKNGKGSVTAGEAEKADCTLELADSDFMDMTSGKADPQKLYFGGKLKIGGNLMASQKLTFLQKMDPEKAKKAVVAARKANAGAAPKAAAAPSAKKESQTPVIFKALAARVSSTPGLVAEIGTVLQFKIKSPDSVWTVDLKSGVVKEGPADAAAATFALAEEDLVALARSESAESVKDIFQRGKLRVDGDVRLAHKLGFFKGLV